MTIAQLIDNPVLLVLALLVAIFGIGRLTRVAVYDPFPPAIAVRMAWDRLVPDDNPWNKLLHCWWCASFWITGICVGWFMWGQIDGWAWINVIWWVFWGMLALGYAATMVIVRDDPND